MHSKLGSTQELWNAVSGLSMLVRNAAQIKMCSVTESRSRHYEGRDDNIQGDKQWIRVLYKRDEVDEEEGASIETRKYGPPNEAALSLGCTQPRPLAHGRMQLRWT
jgi:hypothetical protein